MTNTIGSDDGSQITDNSITPEQAKEIEKRLIEARIDRPDDGSRKAEEYASDYSDNYAGYPHAKSISYLGAFNGFKDGFIVGRASLFNDEELNVLQFGLEYLIERGWHDKGRKERWQPILSKIAAMRQSKTEEK